MVDYNLDLWVVLDDFNQVLSGNVSEREALLLLASGHRAAFVIQRRTAQEANAGAAGVRGHDSFAYGRFVVFGHPGLVRAIKNKL
jgi:hypothetical protein